MREGAPGGAAGMYRGGHGFARPENALKRSEELVGVGQRRAALQALHDVVTSRRHRSWTPASEAVMKRYCELCIELRTPRMVKDGLISYKNSTLNVRRPGPRAASSRPPRPAGPPGRGPSPRRPPPGAPRGAPGPLPARSRGAQAIPGPPPPPPPPPWPTPRPGGAAAAAAPNFKFKFKLN